MLWYVRSSLLKLSYTLLHASLRFCLWVHPWMDIWVVSAFWLAVKHCCECWTVNSSFKMLASVWSTYWRRWHCSGYNNVLHLLRSCPTLFYTYHFTFPPAVHKSSNCFTALPIFILYHCLFFSNDHLHENALCLEVHFPGVSAVRRIFIGLWQFE